MKLYRLAYSSKDWTLNDLYLKDVNLIVGKNAVGKSKTIEVLNRFVSLILQSEELHDYDNFTYTVDFILDSKLLSYSFVCQEGIIISEKMIYDNSTFITRNENETTITKQDGDNIIYEKINPPTNKLTLNVRRDTKQYPYIEHTINWAENSFGILFNRISSANKTDLFNVLSHYDPLLSMFEKLNDTAKNEISHKLRELNYSIENIEVLDIDNKFKILKINETGVKCLLWEGLLSQGMLRTLFLLVLVKYLSVLKKTTQTIVIDDFCEGLDYDRSIKLGKYIYDFCLEYKIQLITTSNDSFLMDVVDLQYWNILQREGSTVKAISKETYPQLFEDFEFTGLSNFDLFSSDFIARHRK